MFGSQLVNENATWDEVGAVLEVMEAGRWTSVYAYDHFIPPLHRTAEIMAHELHPTLEGWTLLASIAAVTEKLELGILVSGNTYRNPALLAKMAATIDVVSGGRVMLGIGAGWNIREHEAYGWDFPSMRERSDRLEEACALIRRLFHSEGRVDFEGKYYQLRQAAFAPRQGGDHPIPIMVGGTGEKRTLKTLAMYGDIMNVIASPEQVRHLTGVLERHCEAVGRDPNEIAKTLHVPIRIVRDEKEAKEARGPNDWSMIGSPQYVIDRIADFAALGHHRVHAADPAADAGDVPGARRGGVFRVRLNLRRAASAPRHWRVGRQQCASANRSLERPGKGHDGNRHPSEVRWSGRDFGPGLSGGDRSFRGHAWLQTRRGHVAFGREAMGPRFARVRYVPASCQGGWRTPTRCNREPIGRSRLPVPGNR